MVEANLPSGVIRNNTEGVSGDIEKIDTLTVEELAKLWRAYSTKQKLLSNDVGRRLENFFWRIWSCERIRTTIQGAQVAIIFEDISQGHIIRTTPTSSPRNSRLYAVAQRAQEARPPSPHRGRHVSPHNSPKSSERPQAQQMASSDTIVPRKGSEASERERSRPPPILKKPGSEYSTSSKTARIQTPGWKSSDIDPDHDEPMSPAEFEAVRQAFSPRHRAQDADADEVIEDSEMSPTTLGIVDEVPSGSQALPSPKLVKTGSSQALGSALKGKKKPSFVVSSARRRPVMGRRQSSQTKLTSPALIPTRRASEDVTEADLNEIAFKPPSASSTHKSVPSLELCASRSHSPVSDSPFRRPTKDHESTERQDGPEIVHREAAGLLAPRSMWMPLTGSEDLSVPMSRSTSASNAAISTMASKARPASMSSSNMQVVGTMTPTEVTSVAPVRQSMFGRASSLFKGKSKAMFDIGPPETESADVSRRPSVELTPDQPSVGEPQFLMSRSQSQLSSLLDQDRRRDAQRDRNRTDGRKGSK